MGERLLLGNGGVLVKGKRNALLLKMWDTCRADNERGKER